VALLAPWLAILGLLGLKSNRHFSAGWIIAPLAMVVLLTTSLPLVLPTPFNEGLEAAGALTAGLAAVWLLAENGARLSRWLTFLGCLFVMSFAGTLVIGVRHCGQWEAPLVMPPLILLGASIVASTLAISGCGWMNRNGFRPLKLYLGLLAMLLLTWALMVGTLVLVAWLVGNSQIPWFVAGSAIFIFTLFNYAVILPFLVLSSANSFYHQRLLALLHIPIQSSALTEVNPEPLILEVTNPQE
jgi:hypothetical protein